MACGGKGAAMRGGRRISQLRDAGGNTVERYSAGLQEYRAHRQVGARRGSILPDAPDTAGLREAGGLGAA